MISSVICEFNPFHNGHAYLLSRAKEESDAVICVMSGNFVQRGDLAIFDKYKRAEFALKNGADLVINLPVGWSMSSAENFAFGGISLIKSTGISNNIFFGSECGNIEKLKETADIICDENFNNLVKEALKDGVTYAAARQKVAEKYSPLASLILSEPNNTLAIEYIAAAKRLNFSPDFYTVNRIGADHNSFDGIDQYMSGTALRKLIKTNKFEQIKKYVPDNIYEDIICGQYSDISKLDTALLFKLRSLNENDLLKIPDVSEGLENRIIKHLYMCESFSDLLEKVKTKRYTMARIRRILLCAAFGITNEFLKKEPPYIHVLGCTKKGEELIKEISKKSDIPLIINAKDALKLEGFAKKTFELEEQTSGLYAMSFNPMLKSYSQYDKKLLKL